LFVLIKKTNETSVRLHGGIRFLGLGKPLTAGRMMLMQRSKKIKESVAGRNEAGEPDLTKPLNLTEGQKDTIGAIERSTGKYGSMLGFVDLSCKRRNI